MRKIMKSIFILPALIIMSMAMQAQTARGKVSGSIYDALQKPVESATIMLLNAKDSGTVKINVTDKSGKYLFDEISEGVYLVSVSQVGYEKAYSEVFTLSAAKKEVMLKSMELVPAAKVIGGVIVSSKKPLVEQKVDRMIVNVDAMLTNTGSNAMEVLEKSPGVSVDKDGNISLKGKQGVQIYIDGRPTYLSGTDLANYLTNLNSAQLDLIEIMTNPPAKYDAAGNSGVINIKTKKTKQVGYSGSVSSSYTQGRYPRFNESVNFNYRKNKFNFFTTLSYSKRKSFNDIAIQRKFLEKNTKVLKSLFEQDSRMREGGESFNGKLGMDFYASKKSTFGFVLTGFNNPNDFRNNSDVLIYDPNKVLQSRTLAASGNEMRWKNYSSNLNFRHIFDSTGTEITFDVDYLKYNRTNDQFLNNAYFKTDGSVLSKADTLLGDLPQDIRIFTAKTDYLKPLKNGAKFEAGAKVSFVKTDNNAIYDSINYGVRVRDIGRSNHFIYDENVNAAYANYSRPIGKKLFGQFGLRIENTNAKGIQKTTGETFDRHYTQLFPTVFFQYKANEKNSFGINYGKRISRPNYEDLNPFIMFLDRYTFEQGNPNLQPQIAHNFELSHTYKGFLTTTLNYSRTTDVINEILEQNTDRNETFVKKSNIARERQFGLAVNAGGQIKKWWSANVYVNIYNNLFEGIVNGDQVKFSATTGMTNITNQFKIGKTWGAEVGGFYRTASVDGVFQINGFGMLNMGLSKQVMKGKGSVRMSVRDLLWTQKIDGHISYSNIDAAFQQVRDSRLVTIGFNYRFSKGKVNGQKRRTGGASEEQNRVKTGEN